MTSLRYLVIPESVTEIEPYALIDVQMEAFYFLGAYPARNDGLSRIYASPYAENFTMYFLEFVISGQMREGVPCKTLERSSMELVPRDEMPSYFPGENIRPSDFRVRVTTTAGHSFIVSPDDTASVMPAVCSGAPVERVSLSWRGATAEAFISSYKGGICGDGLKWRFSEDGTLVISGTGEMYDYKYTNALPWEELDPEVLRVVLEEGVTSVSSWAFYGMSALQSVSVPSTLNQIGQYAFSTRPQSVYMSDLAAWCGVQLFRMEDNPLYTAENLYVDGHLVNELQIPEGVKTINRYAFSGAPVSQVDLPEGLQSIGVRAFQNSDISAIIFPSTLKSIEKSAFYGCKDLMNAYYRGSQQDWNLSVTQTSQL